MNRRAYIATLSAVGVAGCGQAQNLLMGPEGAVETVITDWIVAIEEGDNETVGELIHPESPDGISLLGIILSFGEPDITIEELNIRVDGSEARADSTIHIPSLETGNNNSDFERFYFNVSDGTISEELVLRETSSGWRIWQHFFPRRPQEDEIAVTDFELSTEVNESVEVPDGTISPGDVETGELPEIPTEEEVLIYDIEGNVQIENVGERRLIAMPLRLVLYDENGNKMQVAANIGDGSGGVVQIDRLDLGETRELEFDGEAFPGDGRPEEVDIELLL